ncbi:nucleoside deaminase, partial [Staphylococcus aureus]|nr:nucleoside deaminase [Staphylococcus aureus]
CVFVHPELGMIGLGHNNTVASCNGTRHAELEAIDQMIEQGYSVSTMAECTLYVTVEPCIMCACALRHVGLKQVVFGCGNEKFGGCGERPLSS